jgi:hypothetical protein
VEGDAPGRIHELIVRIWQRQLILAMRRSASDTSSDVVAKCLFVAGKGSDMVETSTVSLLRVTSNAVAWTSSDNVALTLPIGDLVADSDDVAVSAERPCRLW